jgi:hypothetical protein
VFQSLKFRRLIHEIFLAGLVSPFLTHTIYGENPGKEPLVPAKMDQGNDLLALEVPVGGLVTPVAQWILNFASFTPAKERRSRSLII